MWIDLRQQTDTSFELPITRPITVGSPERMFMFGGVGLAAGLQALQTVTGRPPVWATAQYENYARPGETVVFTVDERVRGNHVSQARVVARSEDREVLSISAALGCRDMIENCGQWTLAPDVPGPEVCAPRDLWWNKQPNDLHHHVEFRIAKGSMQGPAADSQSSQSGNVVVWARPHPDYLGTDYPIDPAFIAIVADFVPSAIGPALNCLAGGNSLDNSIRFHRQVETDWLLCDIQIHGVANGFAHGRMHVFSQDGVLLATASQSLILRLWEDSK